jgi:hypothetical protein
MEQGEEGSNGKAEILMKEFITRFRTVEYTSHPRGLPGEAQGKSSNLSWAANYISGKYENLKTKGNVIVTVMDGKNAPVESHIFY